MGLVSQETVAATKFVPHRLHDPARCWPETNCYVDLWIELLASLDMTPEAAFGFAVTQDLDVDQFSFSKIPLIDLEVLYGLKVRELSIYRSLEQHAMLHLNRGNIFLTEVDAFYLPDTRATTYRRGHSKTTIAVDVMDREARSCSYLHNATRDQVMDEDYLGVFQLTHQSERRDDVLPPYVEVVERPSHALTISHLRDKARLLLRQHLSNRPSRNPFSAWRDTFGQHLEELLLKPHMFHDYAFHFPRLAGSNFELLASHIEWLAPTQLGHAVLAGHRIAQTTKVLQFKLARNVARGRLDLSDDCFDALEADYEIMIDGISRYLS